MSYDPSGDPRLEGDDILKRLAAYLKVDVIDLKEALEHAANTAKVFRGGK